MQKNGPAMQDITLYPYQDKSAGGLVSEGLKSGRAHVVLCPGGGKTLVMADTIRQLSEHGYSDFAVFVPNKALVYQSAEDMAQILGENTEFVGNFSDHLPQHGSQTASNQTDEDEDIAFEPSARQEKHLKRILNTEDEIRGYAAAPKAPGQRRVIISTYQSSERLCSLVDEGIFNANNPLGMPVLQDEAHLIAGEKEEDSPFLRPLKTRFSMHLSLTGTPKILDIARTPRKSKRPTETALELISMSDQTLFGPRAATFNYRDILPYGNVVDFEVRLALMTSEEIEKRFGDTQGDLDRALRCASMIEMDRLTKETGNSRFLVFSRNTDRSKQFIDLARNDFEPNGFEVLHVDSTMKASDIADVIEMMRGHGKYVVGNVGLFGLGTNIKSLDTVVFLDAKSSSIAIMQAMFRAMRKDPQNDGKVARIVVPIVVDSMTPEGIRAALASERFGPMLRTIAGIASCDTTIEDRFREASMSTGLGKTDKSKLPSQFRFSFGSSPAPEMSDIEDLVTSHIYDVFQDQTALMAGKYLAFHQNHGHAPTRKEDSEIAGWIQAKQRQEGRGLMSEEDFAMLDTLPGWEWLPDNPREFSRKHAHFIEAVQTAKSAGHPLDPSMLFAREPQMLAWVTALRKMHRDETLSTAQAEVLDATEGWSWIGGSPSRTTDAANAAAQINAFYRRQPSQDAFREKMNQGRVHFTQGEPRVPIYASSAPIGHDGISDLANRLAGFEALLLRHGLKNRGAEKNPKLAKLQDQQWKQAEAFSDAVVQTAAEDQRIPLFLSRRSPSRRMEFAVESLNQDGTITLSHKNSPIMTVPGLGIATVMRSIQLSQDTPGLSEAITLMDDHPYNAISLTLALPGAFNGTLSDGKTLRDQISKSFIVESIDGFTRLTADGQDTVYVPLQDAGDIDRKRRETELIEYRQQVQKQALQSRDKETPTRRAYRDETEARRIMAARDAETRNERNSHSRGISIQEFVDVLDTGRNPHGISTADLKVMKEKLQQSGRDGILTAEQRKCLNASKRFSWATPLDRPDHIALALEGVARHLETTGRTIGDLSLAQENNALGQAVSLAGGLRKELTTNIAEAPTISVGAMTNIAQFIRKNPDLTPALHNAFVVRKDRTQVLAQGRTLDAGAGNQLN